MLNVNERGEKQDRCLEGGFPLELHECLNTKDSEIQLVSVAICWWLCVAQLVRSDARVKCEHKSINSTTLSMCCCALMHLCVFVFPFAEGGNA